MSWAAPAAPARSWSGLAPPAGFYYLISAECHFRHSLQALIWVVATLLSLETIVGNAMVIIAYKLERSISKQVAEQ